MGMNEIDQKEYDNLKKYVIDVISGEEETLKDYPSEEEWLKANIYDKFQKSGFMLSQQLDNKIFNPDTNHASLMVAGGGPTAYCVIDSDGSAYFHYTDGVNQKIEKLEGKNKDNAFYRYAEEWFGNSFKNNILSMNDDEKRARGIEAFKEVRQEVLDILEGNEEVFKNDDYRDIETYVRENYYPDYEKVMERDNYTGRMNEVFYAKSGFALNEEYKSDLFDFIDNRSYVTFDVSSNTSVIVDSCHNVIICFNNDNISRLEGVAIKDYPKNIFYELASSACCESFTEDKPFISDEEITNRKLKDFCYKSFDDYLNAQTHLYTDTEVLSFEKLVASLKENKFDLTEAVRAVLVDGAYSACDCDGINFTKEDFIKDIKGYVKSLEKISLQSDFDDGTEIFGVNANKLVEIDFDDVEAELKSEFEPKVEVKNKVKPKF